MYDTGDEPRRHHSVYTAVHTRKYIYMPEASTGVHLTVRVDSLGIYAAWDDTTGRNV